MRIINIITQDAGNIGIMDSFAIWEEQLVDDVVKPVEELFIQKAKELGFDDEDESVNELLEEGYWQNNNGDSISLVWSDVTEG